MNRKIFMCKKKLDTIPVGHLTDETFQCIFLQHTTDQSCLKAFLRFQGLSLLWSWMVDGGGKKAKLQREVVINS